jgi:hypothetical protein
MKNRRITIAEYIMDAPKGSRIEHINGDTLDNRRANLRVIPPSADNTGHSGIRHRGSKFEVRAMVDGKRKYIGLFDTLEEALAVRSRFPEYASKPLGHSGASI